jgi:hypothetical protein
MRRTSQGSSALLSLLVACGSSSPSGVGSNDASIDDAGVAPDAAVPFDAAPDGSVPDGATGGDVAAPPADAGKDATAYRDPLEQPFATDSIWNMPIGSGATYVAADIVLPTSNALLGDDDIIVLTPTAPSTPLYRNKADWNPNVSRCPWDAGALIYDVPLPTSFVVGDTPTSSTPNNGLAALLADGRTIKQTQPFARCTAGAPGTSDAVSPDVDLYGPGIPGAHGGSGLSAIGGTLRVGELRPNGGHVHHVLKMELFAHQNYYDDGNHADCYRWPATDCDGYWNDSTSSLEYGGKNPSLGPGSLLAIPPTTSIASLGLTTGAAQELAWTLQNYGAYLVDDTAWSSVSICTESGPAGSFQTQFQSDWGTPFTTNGTSSAFAKDMLVIYAHLSVIGDNAPTTIGGGGTPLQPLAAPLPPVTPADD